MLMQGIFKVDAMFLIVSSLDFDTSRDPTVVAIVHDCFSRLLEDSGCKGFETVAKIGWWSCKAIGILLTGEKPCTSFPLYVNTATSPERVLLVSLSYLLFLI